MGEGQGDRLGQRLAGGAGGTEDGELRQSLGLPHDADDHDFARALLRAVAAADLRQVAVSHERDHDPRQPAALAEPVTPADLSFLGRLRTSGGGGEPAIAELEDVPTLLAVLRGGTLLQRRASALRLRARLIEERALSNEDRRAVSATLMAMRDVETAFEVLRAREALPGARGRQAREEATEFAKIVTSLLAEIEEFWAGQSSHEPVASLPPDQRAQLVLRLRDAPDLVVRHVTAVLEGVDGATSKNARAQLLGSLRHSADPRLVPSLLGLLTARVPELVGDAARALARIDDPRVHPALVAAYERSVVDAERALLAGALGYQGDVRGRGYVRKLLRSDDERVLAAAVDAMESLATKEDTELLVPLLEQPDPVLLSHVVLALGRTGDARALLPLSELRRESALSALWADAEDAEACVRAQLELRGEEAPAPTDSLALASAEKKGIAERKGDRVVVRTRSWIDFLVGELWLAVGGRRRAVARFERAAARSPGWAAPLAAIALMHVRQERPALALTAFRRALEADRGWVQGQAHVIRTLARVFLRRAEEVERGGRLDIARGLLEEVLALDLRRLPGELRFELTRRQEMLRSRSAS